MLAWLALLALAAGPPAVASVALVPYGTLLLLAPSVAYPLARRGGARGPAAALAALAVPVLWIGKECLAMSRVYSAGEALYYALNPLALGLLAAAAAQIAVADLVIARRRAGHWVARPAALRTLALLAAAALAAALALRGHDATAVFWLYVAGHRWLFGA